MPLTFLFLPMLLQASYYVFAYYYSMNSPHSLYALNLCRYKAFMLLPQGLIRGLATQKLNLDDEADEEDLTDILKAAGQTNDVGADGGGGDEKKSTTSGGANAVSGRSTSFIKLNFMTSNVTDAPEDNGPDGVWGRMQALASYFRAKKKGMVSGSKRRLEPSIRALLLMTLPFLLWGFVVVIVNGAGIIE